MTSGTKGTMAVRVKRFLLFAIFPMLMLPFLFIYAYGAWWIIRLLDGFPGGFFRQHPNLTLTGFVIIVCCLLITTGQSMLDALKSRIS